MRDLCLMAGALAQVVARLDSGLPVPQRRAFSRALSNLCRGHKSDPSFPPPSFELVKAALPTVARLLAARGQDAEVLADACRAAAHLLSQGGQAPAGLATSLTALLGHADGRVGAPALRAAAEALPGEASASAAVAAGLAPPLVSLLGHRDPSLRKESLSAVASLSGEAAVQALLDSGALAPTAALLLRDPDSAVKEAAARVLANAAEQGSAEQRLALVEAGCVEALACAVGVSQGADQAALRGLACCGAPAAAPGLAGAHAAERLAASASPRTQASAAGGSAAAAALVEPHLALAARGEPGAEGSGQCAAALPS